ncbi:hypothetical protein [Mucilaginibacter ginkgonis]|uniref:Uncharacterized protein n=1 Tax=Mucilaginibacter ginkgonis TaxID=2682091 RepID=A0A6I4INA4_9SPHI|nr:hypothetical protein [Mucilaginibacter ginkgonis]QQL49545.1 hypothetical protein GO620_015435 [Mucilaginibacter ginkgonis]
MGWFGENFGWLVGSKEDLIKTREANKPKMQQHESEVDYAKTVLTYEDSFNNAYWQKAYIKRGLLVLLIVMVFTNPSFESFKAHVKSKYGFAEDQCKQQFNLIFLGKFSAHGHSFVGAFETFFAIGTTDAQITRVVNKQDSVYKDPTKKRDTFKKFEPLPLPASLDTAADREFHQPTTPPGQPQQQQQQPDTTRF